MGGESRGWIKGEGIKKYKLVGTNSNGGCEVRHREYSSQRTYMHDPWAWTMVWGLFKGLRGGWVKWDKGEKIGTTVIA